MMRGHSGHVVLIAAALLGVSWSSLANGGLQAPGPVYRGSAFSYPRPSVPSASAVAALTSRSDRLVAHAQAVASPAAPAENKEYSSMAQSTVNLVKNIVGAGMLSLPAGVASFSGSPKALVPAVTFTLLLAVFSAYGFVLIADVCKRTGETTYQGAWSKTVSKNTSWIPAAACSAKAGIGCISYSMILGDCLSRILVPLGLPAAVCGRSAVILGMTAVVILPLCSMKSLAPLAKFSVLGVLSNVFICGFVLTRCFDGSYAAGALAQAAPAMPKFVVHSGSVWSTMSDPGFAVLLAILATAFLAHYNAPNFFEQLAPDSNGNKEGRFFIMSVMGFSAAALIFCMVMCGGFLTFGKASLGLILNNYAATDGLAILARVAIAVSLITAYPLVFMGLRKQFVALTGEMGEKLYNESPRALTISLLAVVTLVALNLRNLGTLAAFAGAIFGSFLVYVAPAVMVIRAQQRGLGAKGGALGRAVQFFMVPMGLALGVLGAVQSLK